MKIACSIFVFIILAGTSLLFFSFINQPEYTECNMQAPKAACGGVVYPDGYIPYDKLSEEAKAGRYLFNANCAACHKLDKQSTGPYLRNINERFTTEDIIKFMRNDFSSNIKFTNERGFKCTSFPNLSDEDIQTILHYTN